MLKKGDRLPDFSLQDQDGKLVHIQDLVGKKNIVLFFYPADHTFGCTREACAFRDNYNDLKDLNAEVIGISADTVSSHRRFANDMKLPFVLLSDPDERVKKAFGLKKKLMGILAPRVTYVIDKNGVIRHCYESLVAFSRHSGEAVKKLKEMAAE